jgi:hypothetical protein
MGKRECVTRTGGPMLRGVSGPQVLWGASAPSPQTFALLARTAQHRTVRPVLQEVEQENRLVAPDSANGCGDSPDGPRATFAPATLNEDRSTAPSVTQLLYEKPCN